MDASALSLGDLIDRLCGCMAAARIAERTSDETLRQDAITELRPLYVELLRRTGTHTFSDTAQ